jgi:hypothetical protein
MMIHTQMCVNPLGVAFHHRYPLLPMTEIATVAAPSTFPSALHPLRTGLGHHSHVLLYLVQYFVDGIARGLPDHPLIYLGPGLCNFRGLDAAGDHHYLSRTDVHCEYQLVRRLALFPVFQKAHQHIEDNLDR